jgi:hypothetical protein
MILQKVCYLSFQIVHDAKVLDTKQEKQSFKKKNSSQNNALIDSILQLHQNVGNQSVKKLIHAGSIQAKLMVSQPGDIYEQEADRVAEQVMRMSLQEEGVLSMPSINQEKVSRKCRSCEDEKDIIHKNTRDTEEYEIPENVSQSIDSMRGRGSPLDTSTRSFMETHLGFDFGNVRIHTDEKAAMYAHATNALAFTIGNDVMFGAGQYVPSTRQGKKLIAHELTHVIQQSSQPSKRMCNQYAGEETAKSADTVNAKAYTIGNDIFFAGRQYSTHTYLGRKLLTHELVHVVQEGGSPTLPALPSISVLGTKSIILRQDDATTDSLQTTITAADWSELPAVPHGDIVNYRDDVPFWCLDEANTKLLIGWLGGGAFGGGIGLLSKLLSGVGIPLAILSLLFAGGAWYISNIDAQGGSQGVGINLELPPTPWPRVVPRGTEYCSPNR